MAWGAVTSMHTSVSVKSWKLTIVKRFYKTPPCNLIGSECIGSEIGKLTKELVSGESDLKQEFFRNNFFFYSK